MRTARPTAWAAGATLLGLLAAILPWLLGEAPEDWHALRGMAAGTMAWILSTSACLAGGWICGRAEPRALASRTSGARGRLRVAALCFATATTLGALAFLPSALVGMGRGDLEALGAFLQSRIGWREPWNFLTLTAYGSVTAFSVACLLGSHRRRPLRSVRSLSLVSCASLLLVAAAISFVSGIPSPAARELATKTAATGIFATSLLAALAVLFDRPYSRDGRTPSLAAGIGLTGCLVAALAVGYVTPSASDLSSVDSEREVDGWTLIEGGLANRPDLHALFALAPGSRRLELVRVAAGPPAGQRSHAPQRLPSGTAFLVPRPQADRSGLETGAGIFRSMTGEVRVRSRWLPFVVGSPGIRLNSAAGGFAVSPRLRFAVSTGFDRGWVARLSPMDHGVECCSSHQPEPRYQLELSRKGSHYAPPTVIARDLARPPQVVWIDDHAIQLLFVSTSNTRLIGSSGGENRNETALRSASAATAERALRSLGYINGPRLLDLATYRVAESRWIDRRTSSVSVGSEVRISRDRRSALAPCAVAVTFGGGWCRFDLRDSSLSAVGFEPQHPRAMGVSALELADGGAALLWHSGGPILHWRLSIFDPKGRQRVEVSLEGSKAARFAGELENGSIAVARHPGRGPWRWVGASGWELDAVDPRSGHLRRLAADLRTPRLHSGAAGRVYMDRAGAILIPTADGMLNAEKGERRFEPTLSSTAALSARLVEDRRSRPGDESAEVPVGAR